MTGPGYLTILRVLLPVALGTAITPLDTAVNIAFPAITRHFGQPIEAIQWVVICYVLTYGSLMLGIGRLGDIVGHGRVFRAGLAVSVVAYLLCASAPSYAWLLACRMLQGLGAALVISCGAALATAPFPEAARGRVLALYTTVFGLGSALGPVIGGALVQAHGWEAVFWFRAPIAAAALLLFRDRAGAPPATAREPFDMAGALLLTGSVATALLALNQLRAVAEAPWRPALLALGFLLCLAGFLRRSARSPRPVIRLHHFRSVDFALVNLANVLVQFAGFAVLLLVPYWLLRFSGFAEGWAGLLLAVSPAASMVAALLAGRVMGRIPPQAVAGIGAVLTGAGLLLVGQWGREAGIATVAFALALHGAGLGLYQLAYTDIVTGTMPREDRGVAGSLAQMTRTMGVVGAASLLTLLQRAVEQEWLAMSLPAEIAFLRSFGAVFVSVGLIPLGVAALALLRSARRR